MGSVVNGKFLLILPELVITISERTGDSRSTIGLGGFAGAFCFLGEVIQPNFTYLPDGQTLLTLLFDAILQLFQCIDHGIGGLGDARGYGFINLIDGAARYVGKILVDELFHIIDRRIEMILGRT